MKTRNRIFLSALGAGLIPFSFPPFALWPLCLASLALLFFAIRGTNPRPAFYLACSMALQLTGFRFAGFLKFLPSWRRSSF